MLWYFLSVFIKLLIICPFSFLNTKYHPIQGSVATQYRGVVVEMLMINGVCNMIRRECGYEAKEGS